GGVLLMVDGSPLRANEVRVYVPWIEYTPFQDGRQWIVSPDGNGFVSPNGWAYPGAFQYGVVVYQKDGRRLSVPASKREDAQVLSLDKEFDLLTNVNDSKMDQEVYGDNHARDGTNRGYTLKVIVTRP